MKTVYAAESNRTRRVCTQIKIVRMADTHLFTICHSKARTGLGRLSTTLCPLLFSSASCSLRKLCINTTTTTTTSPLRRGPGVCDAQDPAGVVGRRNRAHPGRGGAGQVRRRGRRRGRLRSGHPQVRRIACHTQLERCRGLRAMHCPLLVDPASSSKWRGQYLADAQLPWPPVRSACYCLAAISSNFRNGRSVCRYVHIRRNVKTTGSLPCGTWLRRPHLNLPSTLESCRLKLDLIVSFFACLLACFCLLACLFRYVQVRPPPEDLSRHPLRGSVSDTPLQRRTGVPTLRPPDPEAARGGHLGAGGRRGQETLRQGVQGEMLV